MCLRDRFHCSWMERQMCGVSTSTERGLMNGNLKNAPKKCVGVSVMVRGTNGKSKIQVALPLYMLPVQPSVE
jgi:hypothetical protein